MSKAPDEHEQEGVSPMNTRHTAVHNIYKVNACVRMRKGDRGADERTYSEDGVHAYQRDVEVFEKRRGGLCGSEVLPVAEPVVFFEVAPELDRRGAGEGMRHQGVHRCTGIPGAVKRREGRGETVNEPVQSDVACIEVVSIRGYGDRGKLGGERISVDVAGWPKLANADGPVGRKRG